MKSKTEIKNDFMALEDAISLRDGTIMCRVLELFPEAQQEVIMPKLEKAFADGAKDWADLLPKLIGPERAADVQGRLQWRNVPKSELQ